MKLLAIKRGSKFQLDGYISGKRLRISLGTASESHAADLKRNIENTVTRENDSQFWAPNCVDCYHRSPFALWLSS